MSDSFFRHNTADQDKKLAASTVQVDGLTYYRQQVEVHSSPAQKDASSRSRVSQLTTLFDGKIVGAEDSLKWDTKGTGQATYAGNSVTLSVTAGTYVVRQSRYFCPYYSGKPQLVEETYASFAPAAGLLKRVGYFSSSAVAPYSAELDGVWLESSESGISLVCSRAGTITHQIPASSWDNAALVAGYDWDTFTVHSIDFLWLGGAALRLFLVVDGEFRLIHTIADHAGYQSDLIMLNPNQPVRYELRSLGGSGSFRTICSQVATEGAGVSELGEELAWYGPQVNANTIGTVYPLTGVRKTAASRQYHVLISFIGAAILTADAGVLLLLRRPTLSAPMTWAANSRVEVGTPAANSTVTATGRILRVIPLVSSGRADANSNALLRTLSIGIDNSPDELILAYSPLTQNQTVVGSLQLEEY